MTGTARRSRDSRLSSRSVCFSGSDHAKHQERTWTAEAEYPRPLTFDPCNRRVTSENEDHLKRKADVRRQVGVTARGIMGNLPVGASTQTWLNGLKTGSPGVSTEERNTVQWSSSRQLQCRRRSCGGRCVRQGLTLSHRLSLTLSHFEATCL